MRNLRKAKVRGRGSSVFLEDVRMIISEEMKIQMTPVSEHFSVIEEDLEESNDYLAGLRVDLKTIKRGVGAVARTCCGI